MVHELCPALLKITLRGQALPRRKTNGDRQVKLPVLRIHLCPRQPRCEAEEHRISCKLDEK